MICRDRIRTGPAPSARLASTNCRDRKDNTWPRTMRAIVSHETAPSATNRTSKRATFAAFGQAGGGQSVPQRRFERAHEHDRHNDRRHRIKNVHDAHQGAVQPPAGVTGHRAPQHADDEADHCADRADHQRNLRATDKPHQQDRGHAHPCPANVATVGGWKLGVGKLLRLIRREERINERECQDENEQDRAAQGDRLARNRRQARAGAVVG